MNKRSCNPKANLLKLEPVKLEPMVENFTKSSVPRSKAVS